MLQAVQKLNQYITNADQQSQFLTEEIYGRGGYSHLSVSRLQGVGM